MPDEFTVQIHFSAEIIVEADSPEEAKEASVALLKNERGKSEYIQPEDLDAYKADILCPDRSKHGVKNYGQKGFPARSLRYSEKGFYLPISVPENQENLFD